MNAITRARLRRAPCCAQCARAAGMTVGSTPVPGVLSPSAEDTYAGNVQARASELDAALTTCSALPPETIATWSTIKAAVDAWVGAKPGLFIFPGQALAWWKAGQTVEDQLDTWQTIAKTQCGFVPPAPPPPPQPLIGPGGTVDTTGVGKGLSDTAEAVKWVAIAAVVVLGVVVLGKVV